METYLIFRVLHVVAGTIWVGTVVFVAAFLMPAMQEAGPDAAKVMGGLVRRRFLDVVPAIAAVTVLTGLWLYWRFTGGFDPVVSASPAGVVFGAGGALGILALTFGVLMMRRNVIRAGALMARAMALPEGSERGALAGEAAARRLTAARWGRTVAVMLVTATVLMALGHYV